MQKCPKVTRTHVEKIKVNSDERLYWYENDIPGSVEVQNRNSTRYYRRDYGVTRLIRNLPNVISLSNTNPVNVIMFKIFSMFRLSLFALILG